MNPIRSRHIIISLIVAFLIFILVIANDNDHRYEYPQTNTFIQSTTSHASSESKVSYYPYNNISHTNSNLNRHEILQTEVKEYREATYWGSKHTTQERTRYFTDYEFETFMREEIEEKDADVYWGAEY